MKLELPASVGLRIQINPLLDFHALVNRKTGECKPCQTATYRHLTFEAWDSGRTLVSGSLHKFWHGIHNGSDFPQVALAETVALLEREFGIDPTQAKLQSFEFGVNVSLSAPAIDLLRRAVLCKTEQFGLRTYSGNGYYLEAETQRYNVKLYDKQLHLLDKGHHTPLPLLRAEVKVKKMVWVKADDITMLADLLKPMCLERLGQRLQNMMRQTLFAPVDISADLTDNERQLLLHGANPNYWQHLRQHHEASFQKKKKNFRELLQTRCVDTLHQQAMQGVAAKWQQLLTATAIPELTCLLDRVGLPFNPRSNPLVTEVEVGMALDSGSRRCQSCGRDISSQSANSKFCSQARYGAAGKQCRNAVNNRKHNAARSVKRLFRLPQLFQPETAINMDNSLKYFALCKVFGRVVETKSV
ncbi:hypothetical protein LJY25_03380 [Hymenobacter sp. BT175]|uniref:hypothetical protein n=1 Tax=Hymenobacter translucens TaxID=2886507 RepID=UPI001D0E6503|nr:hypothetical protein [Hymenobacter translucens]MCC2545472.1 hypothetical protein [Hymenobacter translucens]